MTWLDTLASHPRCVYSGTGAEGILETIFAAIGTTNRYLVDLGVGDETALGHTRLFLGRGWHGLYLDANYARDVNQSRITAENVCDVMAKYNAPGEFDLLALDIDGIDWYVLRALLRSYHPRTFVCGFNDSLPAEPPVTIEYPASHEDKSGTDFGASLEAYRLLAKSHGYVLVHCLRRHAVFVQSEYLPAGAVPEMRWAPQSPPSAMQRQWHTVTTADVP